MFDDQHGMPPPSPCFDLVIPVTAPTCPGAVDTPNAPNEASPTCLVALGASGLASTSCTSLKHAQNVVAGKMGHTTHCGIHAKFISPLAGPLHMQ